MHQFLRTHTARKRHTCEACGTDIQPGQEYIRVAVVDEEFQVHKVHQGRCPTERRRSRRPTLPQRGWVSGTKKHKTS